MNEYKQPRYLLLITELSWDPGYCVSNVVFFFLHPDITHLPAPQRNDQIPTGLLFMPEVTHDEFLKGCASRGLGVLSQGVTQEALVGSELPGPAHKTQALRELQLLPRNRCCCFFPM